MKVICYLLIYGFIAGACCKDIQCKLKDIIGVCKATFKYSVPYSVEGEQTAPKPECITVGYNEEQDEIHLTWTQKWSDMNYVEGYYVEANSADSADGPEQWVLFLDKVKLQQYRDGQQTYATFNFDEIYPGQGMFISLYSLPMYQYQDKDYYVSIKIQDYTNIDRDSCPTDNTIRLPRSTEGTTMTPKTMRLPTSTEGTTTPEPIVIKEQHYTGQGKEEDTARKRGEEQDLGQMVPLNITIMACILSVLAVLVVFLLVGVLYFSACKAIERSQKNRMQMDTQKKQCPTKPGGTKKPKVLIVTSMLEGVKGGTNELFKKAALSLANILYESGEYEATCNLWMTKEIAQKGVALWAHEIVRSNDKIVVLCNPTTVEAFNRFVDIEASSTDNGSLFQLDSSFQILYTLIRDVGKSGNKLITACMNDEDHQCLKNLPLPCLENCEIFALPHQFQEFLDALSPVGRNVMRGDQIAQMHWKFNRMVAKNKAKYEQSCFSNPSKNEIVIEKRVDNSTTPEKFCLLDEEKYQIHRQDYQYFVCAKSNSPFASSTAVKLLPEVQYDSMYSSRCNSHSTDTISSCEDTGFHENSHKKISVDLTRYQCSGARPKIILTK